MVKPQIEEHYHIEELIHGQEKKTADRVYHQNRVKALEERKELINNSLMVISTDFFCNTCKQDFKALAVLQVEQDWNCDTQDIAFYKSKHRTCGSWCIRLVTDKGRDGFFVRSKNLWRDRVKHFNDLVQPNQEGFTMLYGKK